MNSNEQQLLNELKKAFPDFKCTIQDIKNPTEEFVTNFYSNWLVEFAVDISQINQIQFEQAAIVGSYQDAFSSILPKLNLLKCLKAFEVVPELGMLDIVNPAPKRTQYLLRSFIEYYQWADERVAQVFNKRQAVKQRKDVVLALLKEREEMRESLNSVTKQIATIQDQTVQLEAEIQVLQQKALETKAEKQDAKEKVDEYCEKLKEKEAMLQKLNKEETLLMSKMKELSTLVVDSPSSILSDIENLRLKDKELCELSQQKRDMVELKMQDHNKLENILLKIQQKTDEFKDLLHLVEQHSGQNQALILAEKKTVDVQEKLKEMKATLLSLTNKKRNRQETLQALHLKWATLKPQMTESVESAARELNEQRNFKSKMISNLQEDAAVQERIDSLKKDIKCAVAEFENDYNLLLQMEKQQILKLHGKFLQNNQNLRNKLTKKYERPENESKGIENMNKRNEKKKREK